MGNKKSFARLFFDAVVFCALAQVTRAYVLEGQSWTRDRTVVMQLSLGGTRNLSDGSTSFNQVAQSALSIWNQYLNHLKFSYVNNSPVQPDGSDDEMSVLFSNTIFGDTFGSSTLAVTLLSSRGSVMEETDTLFNTAFNWDSYRGALRSGAEDFRRVAIHEFGHTLGLDHPDEHGQNVNAIMNSRESNTELPQTDDINGVQSLYNSGPAFANSSNGPVLLNISTRALIGSGQNVLIGGFIVQGSQPVTVILRAIGYSLREVGITNALNDPMITVYNANNQVVATSDDWFTDADAQTIASYGLDPHNSIESAIYMTLNPGAYTAVVQSFSNNTQQATSGVGLFELYDLHTTGGRAGNVSSRGQVQTGDNVLIGGFIVGAGANKEVIIRALGPSLASGGISNPLSDPTVSLYDANGTLLQSNNDWQQDPNASTIAGRGLAPPNSKESATLATLSPGNYTAIVSGVNGATGVGLVEVYDQSAPPP
ncbi:MAG: DVUA0089 family protein [Chthoniobacterales bacterium]